MKIRMAIPALGILMAVPAAWAQAGGSATAAPIKVGVLNVQVAITSTAEGKQAASELQSQFAPRQTELDNLRKQIEDLQTRLRTGQATLSDDEKARLAHEGDQLTRTYQRKQQDSQDDFNEAQQEVVNRIGRKMIDVLNKYARDNGYAVIFDSSAQNSPVVYASNQVDLTQEIIRLYDQSYPLKASGTAPGQTSKPPVSRP
ncbi:MAG TPA: OmpH family outer membrane protein [Candidatus Acidoferrum sp.]|nr:OmpH family outer membrane protein [Candidatus Acidoferrum sp.]